VLHNDLTLFVRIAGPLAASILAYWFWQYVRKTHANPARQDRLLVLTYVLSRVGIWLIFAIYLQQFISSSDPRLYYIPQLEHFLRGEIPIRDFYYPYAPLLMPVMLPFYVLAGHSLAGISLFAIIAEALALLFFLKSASVLEERGELSHSWVVNAMALYLLNPATLYWTVFQGYHSIVQTTYSMAALYFLLVNRHTIGYATGLYSIAGAKLLAVLDWPALLLVTRPRLIKFVLSVIPIVITYLGFQLITGDILFPVRYHIGYASEGNIWYLATVLGDLHSFYSVFPGNLLPVFCFGLAVAAGYGYWLKNLRQGLTFFSFQAAMGMTTFTMALFFLFSLYTGNYYAPMLMLPACVVVTCPAYPARSSILLLLLISYLGFVGDGVWTALGQPTVIRDLSWAGSSAQRVLMGFWIVGILIRIGCFARLAQLGLRVAITKPVQTPTALFPFHSAGIRTGEMTTVVS
jgi:hypothetical protein